MNYKNGKDYLHEATLTSPTLVTPVLGTPTSGDLKNCSAATDALKGRLS